MKNILKIAKWDQQQWNMPKMNGDKDDLFIDDSMSMQAESPNVLYYIYMYYGPKDAYGRGPSHGRSEKHETHVLKDPSPQKNFLT